MRNADDAGPTGTSRDDGSRSTNDEAAAVDTTVSPRDDGSSSTTDDAPAVDTTSDARDAMLDATIDREASTGGGAWDAGVCADDPSPRCAPARHVATAADFVAIATNFGWQTATLGKGYPLAISDDLVADADLELVASTVPPPTGCNQWTSDAGCPIPRFRESLYPRTDGAGRVAGLTCLDPSPPISVPPRPGLTVSCGRMAVAKGTTFRLRNLLQNSMWGYGSFLELDRGCNVACDAEETRCDVNQTCFHRGFESCNWCEGVPAALCACRDRCGGTMVDGNECSYEASDDVSGGGRCIAGKCCDPFNCRDD